VVATPRAWGLAWLTPFCVWLAAAGGCLETRRGLGEECLKDEDCLSRVCAQLHCSPSPTTVDAQAYADAPTDEANIAAPMDAADAGDTTDSADGTGARDATTDAMDAVTAIEDGSSNDAADATDAQTMSDAPESSSTDAPMAGDGSAD
jgi:hypothetical protein